VVLDAANINITTPGTFTVKAATHDWAGGGSGSATLSALPDAKSKEPTQWIALDYRDGESGSGVEGAQYEIHFEGGPTLTGSLDASGQARHENVNNKPVKRIVYKPRAPGDDKPFDPLQKLLG